MPKRKLGKDSLEALPAVKEALSHPHILTADEEAEFRASRAPSYLVSKSTLTVARVRNGKVVYRTLGRVGADSHEHPDTKARLVKERDLLSAVAKIKRPPIAEAIKARQAKAQTLDAMINDKLDQHASKKSGAASVVAQQTGVTAQHVRRVRKKRI
jgi:hypothetical protein